MILKNRNSKTFYTDYEIKNIPDGMAHSDRVLRYASYYIIEDFLTDDILKEVTNFTEKKHNSLIKGSVIGYTHQEAEQNNMRDSSIHFMEDVEFEKYNDYIANKVSEINKNIFNLDLSCFMTPQYAVYGKGQHFNWHPDGPLGVLDRRGLNCIPDYLAWRKLSTSIALNDESEYTGGDFQIIDPSANPSCSIVNTIRMAKGTAILFPAFSAHRVSPVIDGTRKSLIYWFCGPRWR